MMGIRLVPRVIVGRYDGFIVPFLAVFFSIAAGLALFAWSEAPPVAALLTLVRDPLTSGFGLSETLLKMVPLLLATLSVVVANRVGLWNIGCEGQLVMGAVAATWVTLHLQDVPHVLQPVLVLLVASAAGALWAVPSALLRLYRNVSEILSTLLLNYVALAWLKMLVFGPWKGSDGFPYTDLIGEGWRLPAMFGRVHVGLLVALLLALVLEGVFRTTVIGLKTKLVGASEQAAHYAGVPVARLRLGAFCVAGALAGLAGGMEIIGVQHRLHAGVSSGSGYTALLAAFIAGARPLGSVLAAFGLAALAVGGEAVQVSYPGVSLGIVQVFQGIILLVVVSGQTLRTHRLTWSRA